MHQPYQYEVNLEHYPTSYEEEFSTDAFGSYPPPPSSLSNYNNNKSHLHLQSLSLL